MYIRICFKIVRTWVGINGPAVNVSRRNSIVVSAKIFAIAALDTDRLNELFVTNNAISVIQPNNLHWHYTVRSLASRWVSTLIASHYTWAPSVCGVSNLIK